MVHCIVRDGLLESMQHTMDAGFMEAVRVRCLVKVLEIVYAAVFEDIGDQQRVRALISNALKGGADGGRDAMDALPPDWVPVEIVQDVLRVGSVYLSRGEWLL